MDAETVMADAAPAAEVWQARLFMYMDETKQWHYRKLDERGAFLDDATYLSKDKGLRGLQPGCVYLCRIEPELGTWYPRSARFDRRWHDTATVVQWEAQHRTAAIVAMAERAERNITDEMAEALLPFRRAWRATNWQGRRALEAIVLEYLRKLPPDED